MTRQIHCVKLGEEAPSLTAPPFPGALGQRIYAEISQPAWAMWLDQQVMLINEYRLSLIDPKTREFLRQEMEKFLFDQQDTKPPGFVPQHSENT